MANGGERDEMKALGGAEGIRWEIREITPTWAEEMVVRAVTKEKVPQGEIERLGRDMACAWIYNGDAIIFDDRDRLINGRRRLLACMAAGVGFKSLVFYNVASGAQDRIDTQRSRRLADVMGIRGLQNGRSIGTAIKMIHASRDGHFLADQRVPSDQQLLAILDRYGDILTSIAFARRSGRYVPLPLFAALHFLIGRIDQRLANQFFAAICDPKNLRDNEPEKVLFSKLEGWRRGRVHPDHPVMAAAIVLAWNARFNGVARYKLEWNPETAFPEIAGWRDDCSIDVAPSVVGAADLGRPEAEAAMSSELWKSETVVLVPRLTVAMARDFLSRNTINRPPYQPVIDKYVRDLQSGAWLGHSGETVKVARTGRLLDGQHRLMAIVESGIEPPAAIAYGLAEEAFETLDRGDRKLFSDVLSGRSVPNAGAVSAAVRLLWYFENWGFRYPGGRRPLASNAELDDVLKRHPRLVDCHHFNNRLRRRMVPSVTMLAEYLLTEIGGDAAMVFLDRVATGLGCQAGDPAYVLRERLTELAVIDAGEQNPVMQLALVVKAWNAIVKGKTLRALSWDPKELNEAGFPVPLAPAVADDQRDVQGSLADFLGGDGERAQAVAL